MSAVPHERRRFTRRGVKSLAYVDLGNDSGGIVLNISEAGLAVHSAVALAQRALPAIRFQLPNSSEWVAARGEVAWIDASRKEAGIRFSVLPDAARAHIREWIASPADDSTQIEPTIGGMQFASLRLGRIPAVREANSLPREVEGIDRKLRLHFANRDSAPAKPARAGNGIWWSLIFAIGILAILSFGFGWIAGHGKLDRFSAALARISGRAVTHAQNALPGATTAGAAPATATNGALPIGSAPSAALLPHVTFTTRTYVPVMNDGAGPADAIRTLELGELSKRVDPVYPDMALSQHIEGAVQIRATISAEGQVDSVSAISGDSVLTAAAEDAVRQWRYTPTLLDGNPVPTEQAITFAFSLSPAR